MENQSRRKSLNPKPNRDNEVEPACKYGFMGVSVGGSAVLGRIYVSGLGLGALKV